MGSIEALSLAMGTAWTAGINLYATVAALGLAGRFEMIRLPQSLEVLTNPFVIAVAGSHQSMLGRPQVETLARELALRLGGPPASEGTS